MSARGSRPSLTGAVIWIGVGVLILLSNLHVVPGLWELVARYWPILLILLGLGKVIDYFRQKGGVSLRLGEIFGILVLVLVGVTITKISESRLGEVFREIPIRIGQTSVRPGQWIGTSHRYSDEAKYAVGAATPIRVENSYGSVILTPGSDNEVRVRLTKIVYDKDESRAKQIASEIRLEGGPEGSAEASSFLVRTNRALLSSKDYRFNTDLEVSVPAKASVLVRNSYGEVRAANLSGKLDLGTSHNSLDVRDCSGEVTGSNRYADSRFSNLTGNLTVDSRGRVNIETVKGDVSVQNEYSPVEITDVDGKLTVSNTEGRISVSKISKPVTIEGRGSEVIASRLEDSLKITASHRRVQISEVAAGVTLQSQYASVTIKDVKGDVDVNSNYDRINLDGVGGSLKIRGQGTSVQANAIGGSAEIASTLKEITVNNFSGACSVTNEFADVTLSSGRWLKGAVTVKNRNGNIDVFLPETAGFLVDATARNGRVDTNFPKLEPQQGPSDVWSLKGKVNAGGPLLKLETEYDNIRLRTREAETEAEGSGRQRRRTGTV